MAIDAYTIKHLDAYIEANIWAADSVAFRLWVIEALEEDPGLADQGWTSLYRYWMNNIKEGSA